MVYAFVITCEDTSLRAAGPSLGVNLTIVMSLLGATTMSVAACIATRVSLAAYDCACGVLREDPSGLQLSLGAGTIGAVLLV